MKALRQRAVSLTTHGVILLLGFFAGNHLVRDGQPENRQDRTRLRNQHDTRSDAGRSAIWIDDALRDFQEHTAREEAENRTPPTLADQLKKLREEVEADRLALGERVERIVRAAQGREIGADPAGAIRAALRESGDRSDEALVILQSWLEADPDAALAELGKNTEILRGGVVPELKTRMVSAFVATWPMETPVACARFLASGVPVELRLQFLDDFTFPNDPWRREETGEWFDELCVAIHPDLLPERHQKRALQSGSKPGESPPATPSLKELINASVEEGRPLEEAVDDALVWEIDRVINEGTDLMELYGEGRISRRELLEKLRWRIPGAESYPDALERAAWRQTARDSDPHKAMRWADELSIREDMTQLISQAFTSFSLFEDPRTLHCLNRMQTIRKAPGDGPLRSRIAQEEVSEWRRWREMSPASADAWRDALPPADSLRKALAHQRETKRSGKEDAP